MTYAMQGIKVLDFSMGVAGPHAGMLCAQYGAEVIKIESLVGDWARVLGQQYGDLSAFSLIYNRGKRSVSMDMKDPDVLAIIQKMVLEADVIIEAFRPGVMEKFGLDYESVRKGNPGVIYTSVTGFGPKGPLAEAPATDAILQAFSGLMNCNQDSQGTPQRIDLILIDVITGLYAFQGIATSLLERQRNGFAGKRIDCSLMKSAVAMQAGKIVENHIESGDRALYVPLGVFSSSDGHISISVRRDDHFATLCNAFGRPDLISCGLYVTGQQRVDRASELLPILRAEFAKRTTEEVVALLTKADILHSRVNTYPEMLAHEQVKVANAIQWEVQDGLEMALPIPAIPGIPNIPGRDQAPHLGQHSTEILQGWGVDQAQIDRLVGKGSVKETPPMGNAAKAKATAAA